MHECIPNVSQSILPLFWPDYVPVFRIFPDFFPDFDNVTNFQEIDWNKIDLCVIEKFSFFPVFLISSNDFQCINVFFCIKKIKTKLFILNFALLSFIPSNIWVFLHVINKLSEAFCHEVGLKKIFKSSISKTFNDSLKSFGATVRLRRGLTPRSVDSKSEHATF